MKCQRAMQLHITTCFVCDNILKWTSTCAKMAGRGDIARLADGMKSATQSLMEKAAVWCTLKTTTFQLLDLVLRNEYDVVSKYTKYRMIIIKKFSEIKLMFNFYGRIIFRMQGMNCQNVLESYWKLDRIYIKPLLLDYIIHSPLIHISYTKILCTHIL